MDRYIVATEGSVDCYNIWEHVCTADELTRDLKEAGFDDHIDFYGDVNGAPYTHENETICTVASRPNNPRI